jgi:GST-like protein
MVIVVPTNKSVLEFKGLHLYHADRSNCAARVRLLLEEKEIAWTSHHIDLGKKENISEEYFGINPKGVVPALVHDGTVITESNDILVYLEETFPKPGFRAVAADRQSEIDYWLKMSGDLHLPAIKTHQYYKMNAALLEKTDEELALYSKLQTDPELLAFHGKHGKGRSFSDANADAAVALLDENFAKMEQAIAEAGWVVGDSYTLADISWSPTITTLLAGGFDFSKYPYIEDWYERICQRPQFEKAVMEWRRRATYAVTDPTVVSQTDTV